MVKKKTKNAKSTENNSCHWKKQADSKVVWKKGRPGVTNHHSGKKTLLQKSNWKHKQWKGGQAINIKRGKGKGKNNKPDWGKNDKGERLNGQKNAPDLGGIGVKNKKLLHRGGRVPADGQSPRLETNDRSFRKKKGKGTAKIKKAIRTLSADRNRQGQGRNVFRTEEGKTEIDVGKRRR